MSSLSHHASAAQIAALAATQQQRLKELRLHERPFVLAMAQTPQHAATLKAAAELGVRVVLAPGGAPPILALAAGQAGVGLVVTVDAEDGSLRATGGESEEGEEHTQGPLRRWARAWASAGMCACATSGSGQFGSQLVAYRWAACDLQAQATAARTLAEAAPNGGACRFVAASSIGHAYNLNGMFGALAADAELCLPANGEQLAATLAAPPAGCEATVLFATPQMYSSLLQQDPLLSGALRDALRAYAKPLYAFSAGCPLPHESRAKLGEMLGVRVMQNFGTSETGNIALEEIHPAEHALPGSSLALGPPPADGAADHELQACKGVPWGQLELRPPLGGALLPAGAEGEVTIHVEWMSEGYLLGGQLVPHSAAPFVRTGDAGRAGPPSPVSGRSTLSVMQRLRPPLEIRRDGLRVQVQQYEVEEALLRSNPAASAAAALQGPSGQLLCAVAMPEGGAEPELDGQLQPDRLVRMVQLPTSPAGKIHYSVLYEQFWSDLQ